MAAVNILNIQPNKVSRDMRGYSVMLYGTPKSGKTTTASKFPKALLIAFEKGYSAIPDVMAAPVYSWSDFRNILRQLDTPESKEAYSTIVIDTADIAYDYCIKYICAKASDAQHDYDNIGDIPYGKGYKMAETEFDECLRKILQMDYGLVLISHATDKTFTDTNGQEYSQIVPTLDARARKICERTCDIIGYTHGEFNADGGTTTYMEMRGTPRFVAGSRFTYTPDRIVLSYENLRQAIADAIDKEAEVKGSHVLTDEKPVVHQDAEPVYDFDAMMSEFNELVSALMNDTAKQSANAKKITAIADKYLGKGKKVGDCTPSNAPQLDLILVELRELVK